MLFERQVNTKKRVEFVDITGMISEIIKKSGIKDGLCVVYVPHTTAGVTINENADPTVRMDIAQVLGELVPRNKPEYRHLEGNSDSHVKTSMMGSSVSIPIVNGQLLLGTWQGVFFCEFDGPRARKVYIKLLAC